jgi:hypothetical protein
LCGRKGKGGRPAFGKRKKVVKFDKPYMIIKFVLKLGSVQNPHKVRVIRSASSTHA